VKNLSRQGSSPNIGEISAQLRQDSERTDQSQGLLKIQTIQMPKDHGSIQPLTPSLPPRKKDKHEIKKGGQSLPQSGVLRKKFEADQRQGDRRANVITNESIEPLIKLIPLNVYDDKLMATLISKLQIGYNNEALLTAVVVCLCNENEEAFDQLMAAGTLDQEYLDVLKSRPFNDLADSASKECRSLFSRGLQVAIHVGSITAVF